MLRPAVLVVALALAGAALLFSAGAHAQQPQTPLPPPTPLGPTTCGSFGALALDAAVPLLDDRLRIQPLHGMRDEAPAHSIMAADMPSAEGTRLILDDHGRKLVVFAYEAPHASAPADLVPAARGVIASYYEQPSASALVPVSVVAPPLTVAAFLPGPPPAAAESVAVLAAIVVPPDGHPIGVGVLVTPNVRGAGCTELARKILQTLTPGPRALAVPAAHDETLSGLVRVHVPASWSYSVQHGPDFEVHHFTRLDPLGATTPTSVGVYVGGYPQTPPTPTRTIHGRLLGQRIDWGVTTEGTGLEAQAIVRPPHASLVAHVWAIGADDASLTAARAFAETFTLIPPAPPQPQPPP